MVIFRRHWPKCHMLEKVESLTIGSSVEKFRRSLMDTDSSVPSFGTTFQATCIEDHEHWWGGKTLSYVDAHNEALAHDKSKHAGIRTATVLTWPAYTL